MAVPASQGRGRPPKKTATAMARIIEVARMGLPLHFAAKAGDITEEALLQWRRKDPKFARDLEAARLRRLSAVGAGSRKPPRVAQSICRIGRPMLGAWREFMVSTSLGRICS
jgi:hypothetical protein